MAHLSQPEYQGPVPGFVPESPQVCPSWCNQALHDDGWHVSDWRTWEADDSPRFELQLVRHDETGAPWPDSVGQTDLNVRVAKNSVAAPVNSDGFLLPNDLRTFAVWLAELADEADPHRLNGEPLAWHTERRGA